MNGRGGKPIEYFWRREGGEDIVNMIPVKDAIGDVTYVSPGHEEYRVKLFKKDEIARAETIVDALKGLSIESAQELLKKIDKYLLQTLLVG